MFTLDTPTIEDGVVKTIANARELVEAAITLRSTDTNSNNQGYSIFFMQTGLEEAAKASFLFEKYIRSLGKGSVRIGTREWKLWMGGRRSHLKRVARVQYLYALTEQESSMPGAPIIFPQGVEEMLRNRNAALYVDFNSEEKGFKSPSEIVNPDFLTGNSSFAQHILHSTRYDKAIEFIKSTILNNQEKKTWFLKSIWREFDRKEQEVRMESADYKKQLSANQDTFEKKAETIFCARLRTDEKLGLLYCSTLGTRNNSFFLMDEKTNHFAIHPKGEIVHARFAGTVEEAPNIRRNEWEVIGFHP